VSQWHILSLALKIQANGRNIEDFWPKESKIAQTSESSRGRLWPSVEDAPQLSQVPHMRKMRLGVSSAIAPDMQSAYIGPPEEGKLRILRGIKGFVDNLMGQP
jgi:hypothetical protein